MGRIAGIIDHNHNRIAKDQAAFFGFFESVDDAAVSRRFSRRSSAGPAKQACNACSAR